MSWTCDQTEARISDYLDGAMTLAQEAAFTSHVASCPNCTRLLASVKGVIKDLRNVDQVEVPPQLIYSILDATLGPRLTPWQVFTKWLRSLATPKFAYGAGSVMATCLILLGASGTSLKKAKLADLTPSAMYLNVQRQVHVSYAKSRKYVMDLRVVYEIQSRLRQEENQLQVKPDDNVPKSDEKQPGHGDDQTHTQPKQQNRANELARQMQMLAAELPATWERSIQ